MTVTLDKLERVGDTLTARVSSSLSGTVYFHWYFGGVWLGVTTEAQRTFYLPPGSGQATLDVLDTTDPNFDPIAGAPAGFPPRRELRWLRSQDANCAYYRIEQQQDGGGWTTLCLIQHRPAVWEYRYLTARLADLATYSWRVVAVDRSGMGLPGNDGTPLVVDTELIVRVPDAPEYTTTFDNATQKVTFASV